MLENLPTGTLSAAGLVLAAAFVTYKRKVIFATIKYYLVVVLVVGAALYHFYPG